MPRECPRQLRYHPTSIYAVAEDNQKLKSEVWLCTHCRLTPEKKQLLRRGHLALINGNSSGIALTCGFMRDASFQVNQCNGGKAASIRFDCPITPRVIPIKPAAKWLSVY
jgi:hypothetical protein